MFRFDLQTLTSGLAPFEPPASVFSKATMKKKIILLGSFFPLLPFFSAVQAVLHEASRKAHGFESFVDYHIFHTKNHTLKPYFFFFQKNTAPHNPERFI